jgi:hypothetical protein
MRDTCATLADMALRGEGGPKDEAGALAAAKKACALRSGPACRIAGDLTIGRDRAAALEAYARGCKAVDERSCWISERLVGKDATWASMGRLNVESVTFDGTKFTSVACETEDYGGVPTVLLRAIAARHESLDACAKGAVATPVTVTAEKGTFTKVYAAGTRHDVNGCVEQALKGAEVTVAGRCSLIVEHGRASAPRGTPRAP